MKLILAFAAILLWIKENLFDWTPPPMYSSHRPPSHPPGWRNTKAKKRKASK